MKRWVRILGLSLLASSLLATTMMKYALAHNPQGEFCTRLEEQSAECVIQWGHLLTLGFLWFLPSFLLLGACGLLLTGVVAGLRRRDSSRSQADA